MAMDQAIALKKAQETLEASETVRLTFEAKCGLDLAYAYGSQWASTSPGRRGGQQLNQLRTITQANRTDVRFAMNKIGPRIIKLDSVLKLKTLASRAVPATRSNEDQIIALVADARLKHHLKSANGKRVLRRASLWRLVLGSVVVRRCMASYGKETEVFDRDGKRSVNPVTNRPRRLRNFRHSWSVCAPYEFIRDPSAKTLDFDDEEIIGHEKPRTTEWLMRNYGVDITTETTMGDLYEFQRFLHGAIGQTMNEGISMSKAKGVMVSEWLFKDPDGNDEWDMWMLAFRDMTGEGADGKNLVPVRFGPNPYSGLPFHHFWYNPMIESPWGQSVPEIMVQVQDATNIAYSMAIRAMIYHASPKWVIEADSLVDKPERALSNRTDVPVIVKRNTLVQPQRLAPGQMSPEVHNILDKTSTWFDAMLNMSPIQQGIGSPRGEAGRALEIKRDYADTPLAAISDEDEITVNELLTGTLHDISKTDSLKALRADLGGQFSFDQIALFKSADSRKAISGVAVEPDSMRPRTPDEMRADALANVNSQMVDAVTARRTLLVHGRIALDAKEGRAYHRQLAETQTLLSGGEVEVYLAQDHDMHMYAISLEQESPEYGSYSEDQKGALQAHWFEHSQMKMILLRMEAEGPQVPGAGQPSQNQVGMDQQGMLPAPMADEGMGGFEDLGQEGSEPYPEQPAIAGSIGPGTGMNMPGAGQVSAFG